LRHFHRIAAPLMNDPVRCLIQDLTNSILHRSLALSFEGAALP
jgi:hypothetical protein